MHLVVAFYWLNMRKRVCNFIAKCLTYQTIKPFNRALQGLLQPLIILGKICDYISIDLITHLLLSHGKTTILVVVNLLSKYANFVALGSQFTAQQVATLFLWEIVRLHGIPSNILSDRDPIFMSSIWREPLKLHGTLVSMSSSYRLQSDGQMEIVNRCLQD